MKHATLLIPDLARSRLPPSFTNEGLKAAVEAARLPRPPGGPLASPRGRALALPR